ncbi:hypothetical protein [Rubritalea tangerina]
MPYSIGPDCSSLMMWGDSKTGGNSQWRDGTSLRREVPSERLLFVA